jgi:hypothetical protein
VQSVTGFVHCLQTLVYHNFKALRLFLCLLHNQPALVILKTTCKTIKLIKMKTQTHKLKLSKSTIAKLDAQKMNQIAGGRMAAIANGFNYETMIPTSFTTPRCNMPGFTS